MKKHSIPVVVSYKNYDRTDSKINLLVADGYFVTLDRSGIGLSELEKSLNGLPLK